MSESFLKHPFIQLAMSLRPPELPLEQRQHPEKSASSTAPTASPVAPAVLPKLVQTFETPEPVDTSEWPVCYKCDRAFSTELALRHHLASAFHNPAPPAQRRRSSASASTGGDESVAASEESWVCELCADRRAFKSALALRMHCVHGNHTRDVFRTPAEVSAVPTSGWGEVKPVSAAVGMGMGMGMGGGWRQRKEPPPPPPPQQQQQTQSGTPQEADPRVEEALRKIAEEIGRTPRVNFSDAMLAEIDVDAEATQFLVLSATRDLALLVHTLLTPRCAALGITTYACVGGTIVRHDITGLAEGPHIVSGTPGRVCDMIHRRALRTDRLRLLVLNKEEMLLNRSMWPQLAAVYGLLDAETRVVRASVRVREGTA